MKTNITVLIISLAMLSSCSVRKVVMRRLQTKMPTSGLDNSKIVEDVNYYTEVVEKVCPYPYSYTTKSKIDGIATVIKNHDFLSSVAFYEKFLTLQGAYNVAHMYSHFPQKQYEEFFKKGGSILPVKCDISNDTVFVVSAYRPDIQLKKGDKILSINNNDADSLFKSFYKYEGGLTELKRRGVAQSFAKYLWLNNINAPFRIESTNGVTKSMYLVQGYKPDDGAKKISQPQKANDLSNIISYTTLQDTIAYIDFKSMSNVDKVKFNDFLASTFQDIKQKKIETLYIDLRNNSGGSSSRGAELIDYFNPKPYRMTASKKWLVSNEYKNNYKKMFPWYARTLAIRMTGRKAYFKHKSGVYYKDQGQNVALNAPKANENRFIGDVYVIIGNRTFSSAMMTANAIQDYDLATLVGEPTGDAPNDLGEIVAIKLPNSGISCWLPSALFVRANGNHEDINPVIPDIAIDGVDKMELSDIINTVKMMQSSR